MKTLILIPILLTATGFSAAIAPGKTEPDPIRPPSPASYPEPPPVTMPVIPAVTVQPPTYRVVRVKVTACSPEDPVDRAYYSRNGYEGRLTRAVAAHFPHFPRGTQLSIPGYAGGQLVPVDSAGGVIIRRSARRGVVQIDVKFKTYREARQWGTRWLDIKVYDDAR